MIASAKLDDIRELMEIKATELFGEAVLRMQSQAGNDGPRRQPGRQDGGCAIHRSIDQSAARWSAGIAATMNLAN